MNEETDYNNARGPLSLTPIRQQLNFRGKPLSTATALFGTCIEKLDHCARNLLCYSGRSDSKEHIQFC